LWISTDQKAKKGSKTKLDRKVETNILRRNQQRKKKARKEERKEGRKEAGLVD
jgi:hypothetical protein